MFGFGYNGNKQLSEVLKLKKHQQTVHGIAEPIEIEPISGESRINKYDYEQQQERGENPENPSQSGSCQSSENHLKYVFISWDSILFIYDTGMWTLSGFRFKDDFLKTGPEKELNSVTSGCILWDSTVVVNAGKGYIGSQGHREIKLDDTDIDVQIQLDGATSLQSVTCGGKHCYAVTDSQRVVTIHKDSESFILRPVGLNVAIRQVSCGKEHAVMVSRIGAVFTCGMGGQGQLGHGDIESRNVPTSVEALQCVSVASVAAGGWHSLALSDLGDIYIWGWNERGQLGFPSKIVQPEEQNSGEVKSCNAGMEEECVNILLQPAIVDVETGSEVTGSEVTVSKVVCGSRHTAAITETGGLYTWGWNKYGQLGHGDTASRDKPTRVEYFTENKLRVLDIYAGYWNTIVLTDKDGFCGKETFR